jgi:hypothetical protein
VKTLKQIVYGTLIVIGGLFIGSLIFVVMLKWLAFLTDALHLYK